MKLSKLGAGSIKRARLLRGQSTSDAKYQALLAYATANAITKPSAYQSAIVEAGVIAVPTFSNFTSTDFNGHGLLTEKTHHQANRGYRTQN